MLVASIMWGLAAPVGKVVMNNGMNGLQLVSLRIGGAAAENGGQGKAPDRVLRQRIQKRRHRHIGFQSVSQNPEVRQRFIHYNDNIGQRFRQNRLV